MNLFLIVLLFSCSKEKNSSGDNTTTPLPPTNLSATTISTSQIDLTWTDISTNEDGFKIQRKTGTGTFSDIGSVGKDITTFKDRALSFASAYTYRIYSYNTAGQSITYSNEVTATTFSTVRIDTKSVSVIGSMLAISGGTITSDGGNPITSRGIVWSTNSGPTITLITKTLDSTGTGQFTSEISGLNANTTYYARAYATNNEGTTYGNEINFKTLPSVTDISGNTYSTVAIGSQVWMGENLRTTKFSDGSIIPLITNMDEWKNNHINSTKSSMMCWYNNDFSTYSANKYGILYNWYVLNPVTNGNKSVCPSGWHVPSNAEWGTLVNNLGGESLAGGSMKSVGTTFWNSPNNGATNSSYFTALPGGFRTNLGSYLYAGSNGYWWSSTLQNPNEPFEYLKTAFFISLDNRNASTTSTGRIALNYGLSIRCVKD